MEVISADQVEAIHLSALKLLAGTGIKVLSAEARRFYAAAGAKIFGEMVRLDAGLVGELLASVPKAFTLAARNPAKSLRKTLEEGREIIFGFGTLPLKIYVDSVVAPVFDHRRKAFVLREHGIEWVFERRPIGDWFFALPNLEY